MLTWSLLNFSFCGKQTLANQGPNSRFVIEGNIKVLMPKSLSSSLGQGE